MFWAIQSNLHIDRGTKRLLQILDRFSIPHAEVKVIPFVGEIEPDISPEGNVICIGSYSMRHVAKKKGWVPGVFDLGHLHHYDYPDLWKQYALNSDAIYCSMKDVPYYFEKASAGTGWVFLRPSTDSKFLAGEVFNKAQVDELVGNLLKLGGETDPAGLSLCTSMMVASPKNIVAEYRFWIVDGKVITWSLYKRGGDVIYSSEIDDDVKWFASTMTQGRQVARAYVLDVARMIDNSFRLIEANTINASGLYAADVQKLVMAIEDMKW